MARRTVAGPQSVRENTLEDVDGDTRVAVEESSDEDKIRFDTAGTQRMIIDETGQVGVGTDAPEEQFHIHGANATLRLGNGTNSGEHSPKIQFSELADASGDMLYGYSVGYNGSTNNLEIKRHQNSVAGGPVLVSNRVSGDVGIKTASPEADLHIYGGNSGQTFSNVTLAVENDGSSDSFYAFQTATAGAAKSFSITNGGKVGIGTSSPQATLHVHADSINNGAVMIGQSDDSGDASQLDLLKSRGSGASPTGVQSGDFVGQVRFLGYEGSSYQSFADIYAQTAGTIDAANHPTKIVIRTTPLGGTSPISAVTIDESQNITAAGGVYGKMRHMTHHRYSDSSGTGKEYIPWAGTSEQPSPSYVAQGVAPYSGRLTAVFVRSNKNGGLGSTEVSVHVGVNGDSFVSSTAEETITVDMSQDDTSYAFDFTGATHFAAGDVIGVAIDPTNQHGNVNVTCIWEYVVTA
mgnify:CR=1 FL=1